MKICCTFGKNFAYQKPQMST